jgi:hypothetical protein
VLASIYRACVPVKAAPIDNGGWRLNRRLERGGCISKLPRCRPSLRTARAATGGRAWGLHEWRKRRPCLEAATAMAVLGEGTSSRGWAYGEEQPELEEKMAMREAKVNLVLESILACKHVLICVDSGILSNPLCGMAFRRNPLLTMAQCQFSHPLHSPGGNPRLPAEESLPCVHLENRFTP